MDGLTSEMTHPAPALLDGYARGAVDITYRLIVEAHLALCAECLALTLEMRPDLPEPAEPVSDAAFECLWERIRSSPEDQNRAKLSGEWRNSPIPKSLRGHLPPPSTWKWFTYWPSRGEAALVCWDRQEDARLYVARVNGGSQIPAHLHLGDEAIVVLKGRLMVEGRAVGPGHWLQAGEGDFHDHPASPEQECWCLVRFGRPGMVRFRGLDSWKNLVVRTIRFFENRGYPY